MILVSGIGLEEGKGAAQPMYSKSYNLNKYYGLSTIQNFSLTSNFYIFIRSLHYFFLKHLSVDGVFGTWCIFKTSLKNEEKKHGVKLCAVKNNSNPHEFQRMCCHGGKKTSHRAN